MNGYSQRDTTGAWTIKHIQKNSRARQNTAQLLKILSDTTQPNV